MTTETKTFDIQKDNVIFANNEKTLALDISVNAIPLYFGDCAVVEIAKAMSVKTGTRVNWKRNRKHYVLEVTKEKLKTLPVSELTFVCFHEREGVSATEDTTGAGKPVISDAVEGGMRFEVHGNPRTTLIQWFMGKPLRIQNTQGAFDEVKVDNIPSKISTNELAKTLDFFFKEEELAYEIWKDYKSVQISPTLMKPMADIQSVVVPEFEFKYSNYEYLVTVKGDKDAKPNVFKVDVNPVDVLASLPERDSDDDEQRCITILPAKDDGEYYSIIVK